MKPILTFCSDIHLTLTPPPCRAESDWLEVQARYLKQLRNLAQGGPIACAGDIFDRWNPPPELIHFALEHLPDGMICIPGQHDLPNHRLDLLHRSAYGVLVKAGKIIDISNDMAELRITNADIYGFAWGQEFESRIVEPNKDHIQIALVHKYVWMDKHSYPGAEESSNVSALRKSLRGWDVAIFGDNHKGFSTKVGNCQVCNNGTFIRRRSDDTFNPMISQLMSNGKLQTVNLYTNDDQYHDVPDKRVETPFDMQDLLHKLEELGEHGVNFQDLVKDHLEGAEISERAKQLVRKAMEDSNGNK